MAIPSPLLHSLILHILLVPGGIITGFATRVFTFNNSCAFTVWPATLSNCADFAFADGGFELPPNSPAVSVQSPAGWSGRIWARTGCIFNNTEALIGCATGDCGGDLKCSGRGKPPVTIAEFTNNGKSEVFYDVSLVDGYNVGVSVTAVAGGETASTCGFAGCVGDVNGRCPAELRVAGVSGETVGCRSACEVFGGEQFCCTSQATCRPTRYSQLFKTECPAAITYANDSLTGMQKCGGGADYTITFCPARVVKFLKV